MVIVRAGVGSRGNAHWGLGNQRNTLAENSGRVSAGGVVALRGARLAEQIGVVFKRIPGGEFIYQGQRARIKTFETAETPLTIDAMKKLLKIKGEEVRRIFTVPGYSVDEVIRKSLDTVAADAPDAERDNCPLVYVDRDEAKAIAQLLESGLVTERQWERAASGKDGKLRPWGNQLDKTRAVYGDSGTRPVKSKPAGVSAEGVHDLIGNVWEWTEEASLRGGSWWLYAAGIFQADYRYPSPSELRNNNVGIRLARRT